MKQIFVNLKRFDVPEIYGGICPMDDPKKWIEWVMDESVRNSLGKLDGIEVVYILPESLLIPAAERLNAYPESETGGIHTGSQSVFRDDVEKGGNFGAFSTNLPAAAAKNMGCTWTMIGHSEEWRDKIGIMCRVSDDMKKVKRMVEEILNEEVMCALERNINVLLCVGETERGSGAEWEQKNNVKEVLKAQLLTDLEGIEPYIGKLKFTIGYEPIWAIGPGKMPPGKEYISFVSSYIKELVREEFGFDIPVVYGGGLKEENAAMIASIDTINGGLVALTTFTVPPKFEPEALKKIIEAYE